MIFVGSKKKKVSIICELRARLRKPKKKIIGCSDFARACESVVHARLLLFPRHTIHVCHVNCGDQLANVQFFEKAKKRLLSLADLLCQSPTRSLRLRSRDLSSSSLFVDGRAKKIEFVKIESGKCTKYESARKITTVFLIK